MQGRRFNTDVWFNWQQPAVPLLLDLTFEACGSRFRQAFGIPFFTSILYYRVEEQGGEPSCQASWLLREQEGVALGRWLTDVLHVPSAATRVEAGFDRSCRRLIEAAAQLREGKGGEEAGQLERDLSGVERFHRAFLDFYAVGSMTEPVQWYCESELARILPGEDEARAAALTMGEEPYVFQVERSLLRMAVAAEAGGPDLDALHRHQRAYYWCANNYARVLQLGIEEVQAEVEELAASRPEQRLMELERQREEALGRKAEVLQGLPPQAVRLCMIADEFGSTMADRRKAVMNESLAGLDAASRRIAEALEIDHADLQMFGPGELRDLAKRRIEPEPEAARRREAYVQVLAPFPLDQAEMDVALDILDDGALVPAAVEPSFVSGTSGVQLLEQLDQRMVVFAGNGAGAVVSGDVVYGAADGQPPTITAPCRIVTDPFRQREEFQAGEILVASSTTPDFVPLMRRAAAVVTNMGGILQHAAHFAREERMPCIVGTGFATSAFESGQEITLDLSTGTIVRAAVTEEARA